MSCKIEFIFRFKIKLNVSDAYFVFDFDAGLIWSPAVGCRFCRLGPLLAEAPEGRAGTLRRTRLDQQRRRLLAGCIGTSFSAATLANPTACSLLSTQNSFLLCGFSLLAAYKSMAAYMAAYIYIYIY